MRISLLFLTVLLATAPFSAHAQSQPEMNATALADFEKADQQLNAVYQKVLAQMDDTGKQKLVAAQKAWLKFRDAQADFDADDARGGSMAPMLSSISAASTTRARTAQLQKWLDDQEGK
ncbi:MAG: lysozyme inhibitor LprI family protein [Methylacidiphilales bacterium]|nr:lysozyme inhibitor LprI family protein [Candidatus Methylacidiphilales bacterium]